MLDTHMKIIETYLYTQAVAGMTWRVQYKVYQMKLCKLYGQISKSSYKYPDDKN